MSFHQENHGSSCPWYSSLSLQKELKRGNSYLCLGALGISHHRHRLRKACSGIPTLRSAQWQCWCPASPPGAQHCRKEISSTVQDVKGHEKLLYRRSQLSALWYKHTPWHIFILLFPKLLTQGSQPVTKEYGWWQPKVVISSLFQLLGSTIGDQRQPCYVYGFCFVSDQRLKILRHCVHACVCVCVWMCTCM